MNHNPLISIIVPIYKVEQYLPRCVDSIINQTYRNLEIILVDDGSPDLCGKICDEYTSRDKRIKVVHKTNGGLSDARNVGIDIANGDFILFVDSDDWLELSACESSLQVALERNADIVIFGIKVISKNGREFLSDFGLKGKVTSFDAIKSVIYQIHENGLYNYAWNKLYSKELFKEIRFPKGKLAEDQGTTYKLFHQAQLIWVCEKHLYNYVQRYGSISSVQFNPRLLADRVELWIDRLAFLESHYPNLAIFQIAQILGDIYVALIKLEKNKENTDFFSRMHLFIKQYRVYEKECVRYNRKVKLHYYCYPLFWIYVKLFA